MALIEAESLSRTFTNDSVSTKALDTASFTIYAGEFISIMGQSGSGKSTLLHLLGLLDHPTDGRYLLDGQDTAKFSDVERAHIRNQQFGFVFQSFHLLARTTVLNNVILPLSYSTLPTSQHRQRAKQAISQVQLTHRQDFYPSQLSGGEKQRVAIARALVNRPKVIFADEPTGNLDSNTGQTIMHLLEQLHEQGHTIIVITHETPVAQYAQRIITLHDGLIQSDQIGQAGHQHKYNK